MTESSKVHENWSSKPAFLLSAIGFAVGLGNFWRFPYIAGEGGGGAFVLIYLTVVLLIGAPLVAAELLIGRRGRLSPIGSMQKLASEAGASPRWGLVGALSLLATFLILTFYSVVAGWALDYLAHAIVSGFANITAEQSERLFDGLMASPFRLAFWQAIVIAVTVLITVRGLSGGIERASLIMMPTLFVIMIFLAVYGMFTSGFDAATSFLFSPDFSKVRPETFLTAIGQAFFSVGIAMGGMMTYGAYMPSSIKVPSSALIIVGADTLVALIAGLAIFPIVFSHGLEPGEGTGLVFHTLPLAFGEMEFGRAFAALFFLLLSAAALTSTLANFEPLLSWAEEHRGWRRPAAGVSFGIAIFIVGAGSVLSFNLLADFHPLGFVEKFSDLTIYALTDFVASNVLLPLGALLTAIFVGWVVKRDALEQEMELGAGSLLFSVWLFLIRFVVPCAIVVLFVYAFIG